MSEEPDLNGKSPSDADGAAKKLAALAARARALGRQGLDKAAKAGAAARDSMKAQADALRGKAGALFNSPKTDSAKAGDNAQHASGDASMSEEDIPANRPAKAARPAPKTGGKRDWRAALLLELGQLAVSLGFIGAIAFLYGAFVLIAPRVPEGIDLWAINREPSIILLDRNGAELAQRGSRYGQAVSVDELPPYLVKAIIATEDRRFYEHRGVDLRGTLRALITNIKSGAVREGGSTITQQLARNLFLSAEQTYIRKAKEALLALWIEGRYSKDQILSLYLNRIYLGAGAYGVEAAARTYFGKSAREINLAEAVMLAGLPKAPSSLAPTQNPFGAQNRANEVLENLRETGAVTEFEAREARTNPPVITSGDARAGLGYFFDYVAAQARQIAGGRKGDLIVTTTLDAKMQRDAEAAVASVIGVDSKLAGAEQAALIAYDVNGAIRAMVGGRSYLESQFNRATQALRQPGSAFKPFVYAAAMEAGLTPQSSFVDQPIDIDGWQPSNYGDGYQGRMRLTEAVAKSVNTIAVQVSELIGREKVVEMAKRLGIRSDIPVVASVALGGVNVTLEELTAAYLPFANFGLSAEPYSIERIEDQNLEVIYQHASAKRTRLFDETVAEEMNHLLYQVMHGGTGAGASLGNRVAAGKTGTTNDWRDAWFIGYTAQLASGVWVGNDDFRPMDHVTGGQLPAKIWKAFMLAASQDMPRKPLKGAYPAPQYADETALISFYADVSRGFAEVRRDGNARRGRRR
ncbi:MAG: PBP1A family penicillin-binding protein [Parvularculaceae bacterium]